MERYSTWIIVSSLALTLGVGCGDDGGESAGGDGGVADAGPEGSQPDDAECPIPEAEPPSCLACLRDDCHEQLMACYCLPECVAQLEAVRECFAEKNTFDEPSDDPSGDWAACQDEVGGGTPTDEYLDVISCAVAEYTAPEEGAEDDPYARTDGDGVCTSACFEVFSFDL